MDEPKIPLPAWLPWATTACLAALVACLGELWIVEKTRNQLLRDQNLLAEAASKGLENQLEAERILNKRELDEARAASGGQARINAALLLPPEASPQRNPSSGAPWGVVIWEANGKGAVVKFSGLPVLGADRDYQLWLEGRGPGFPADCGAFHATPADGASGVQISMAPPLGPDCRLLLIEGVKGGARTLNEAISGGSIVLATLPFSERISHR